MTEHILNIDTDIDESDDNALKHRRGDGHSSTLTIIVSILVHVIVLGVVLQQSFNRHSSKEPAEPEFSAIKAHLYFPPPIPEPVEEIIEEEAVVEEQTTIEEIQVEEVTIEETVVEDPQPIPDQEQPVEVALEQEITPEQITEPAPPETLQTEQNQPTDETSRYSSAQRLRNALGSHLESLQQQKMGEMQSQMTQSRNQTMYQQSLENYKLPEEPESVMKTKRIDCSTTAGEIAGMLSGLTGGNLRCSEEPDFQQYIDAKLNKGTKR